MSEAKDNELEVAPASEGSNKNPMDWLTLFEAMNKNNPIPEWPSIFEMVPALKCDDCSEKFVSQINRRRHILRHHPKSNPDQMLPDKETLKAYLISLSEADFRDAVLLKDMKVGLKKEDSGHSIVQQLKLFINKPKVILPGSYIKAGEKLLDVVQSYQKKYEHPVTVDVLFEILNDASENTFLCSVIDDSVQTFVFEGYVDNIGDKNIVAYTCFLLERKLVADWARGIKAAPLMNELDNQNGSQAKPMVNKKKRRSKKKKKGNAKKPVLGGKRTGEGESDEGDEDALKFPIETPTHGSCPIDVDDNKDDVDDANYQVAQPDQIPKAVLPFNVDKGDIGGCEQKEPDEKIRQENVSTNCDQKDAELQQKEQEIKKQSTRMERPQIKELQGQFENSKEERHGLAARTCNKDKFAIASHADDPDTIRSVKEEIDQVWQKMLLRLQNLQTRNPPRQSRENIIKSLGNKSDTGVLTGTSIPDATGTCNIEEEDDGKSIEKEETSKEQKRQQATDSLQSGEKGCNGIAYGSPKENKVTQPDNGDIDKKEDGGHEQKPDEGLVIAPDTTKEQKTGDTNAQGVKLSSSSPSECIIETQNTPQDQSNSLLKQVVLSNAKKYAESECSKETPHTKELQGQLENTKEEHQGLAAKTCHKDKFGIASLADDPDSIRRVKEDFEQVWQKMLLNLKNLHTRNPTRNYSAGDNIAG